jgi:HAMP domain-containing protein
MELLLNLVWMLLALPAYWLWRRGAATRVARRVSALQCLLALGCALVLLFPVISATDDLHAMRAEMEDSSISKRTVRPAGSEKNSAWVKRLQAPPAAVASAGWLAAPEVGRLEVSVVRVSPRAGSGVLHAGRSPPSSLLG